ncbi:MAG: AAA family ATPase [Psychrobium sp.]
MKRVLIFGNSGSGKSTLAKKLADEKQLAHLDLDTVAWQATTPVSRKPIEESKSLLDDFTSRNDNWVIEGCYADLLELLTPVASKMIFMNLPVEACIANAKARPWEPHKYESKAAQDANLEMLIDWIAQYTERDDTFSQRAHQQLFDSFQGAKKIILENR